MKFKDRLSTFTLNRPMERLTADSRVFVMNHYLALCFGLPVLIFVVGLAFSGVWPFGGKSVLCIDLYHMYATLIAHLHDIIYEGAGGAWSWNIGMGINYFTLFFTNVGSPLNAAIAVFPKAWLPDLVAVGCALKAGLCGLSMGWLLRYKWKHCDYWTVAFALMYALCGWMVNYYWNIMWSDVLILLPLCLLGIELLLDRGRFLTYTLALVTAMVCNYYIAALMCVFLALYFVVTVVARFSLRHEKRWILGRSARFALFSLLAAGIAAAVLLPVAKSLAATSVITDTIPSEWTYYNSYLDVLKNALPGAKPNIRSGGLPHIYAGLLTVWLLPLFITDRRIGGKTRALYPILCAALIFCMNAKIPDFILHGMHTPNDLPFRYSFCISCLMVIMAAPAARRINRKTLPGLMGWGSALLILVLITELVGDQRNLARLIAVPVLTVAFLWLFWLGLQKKRISYDLTMVLALALVCIELGWGTAYSIMGTGNTDRNYYVSQTRKYGTAARATAQSAGDDFYRMETASYMTLNDPALYGFKGLSHFSSMLDVDLQDTMHHLGYHSYMNGNVRANRQAGQPNTPVMDSMLAVRFHMTLDADAEQFLQRGEGLRTRYYADRDVTVAENTYALPLAFLVGEGLLTDWQYNRTEPFRVQNQMVELATGQSGHVLGLLQERSYEGDGLSIKRVSPTQFRFSGTDPDNPGTAVFRYRVDHAMPVYFYADGNQITRVRIKVTPAQNTTAAEEHDGDRYPEINLDYRYPRVIEVGRVTPGDVIEVTLTVGRNRKDGSVYLWTAGLDMAAFESAWQVLEAGADSVDFTYDNSGIRGTYTAQPGQALFTSIPNDSGWQLKIDGYVTDIEAVGGAFVGAKLPTGTHSFELEWTLPGLDTGVKVSVTCLMLLALMCVIARLAPGRTPPATEPYQPWDPTDIPDDPELEAEVNELADWVGEVMGYAGSESQPAVPADFIGPPLPPRPEATQAEGQSEHPQPPIEPQEDLPNEQ